MTKQKTVSIAPMTICNDAPLVLFAGLNVLESRDLALAVGTKLKEVTSRLGISYVFKASFDKANRSSVHSFRGPGLDEGLRILSDLKSELAVPVITDIHEKEQAQPVAEVADVLQIPAFLCRQTDLVRAAATTGAVINVKKMQMMAPWDVKNIVEKFAECGNDKILLCERGTTFGYNNLVVDPLAFPELKKFGHPVIFDVTHALQQPGGLGHATAGRVEHVEPLALAGVSTGIAGLFLETHPDPAAAKCDGPCALALDRVEALLKKVKAFDELAKASY